MPSIAGWGGRLGRSTTDPTRGLRRRRASAVLAGVALLAGTLLAAGGVVGVSAPVAGATPAWRILTYHGERFEVPASWPVTDLATTPSACVRFDRHAVYEGSTGATQDCAARLLGVTAAVQVAPLATTPAGPGLAAATVDGQRALVASDQDVSHRIEVAFPSAGVLAVISYGTDVALAERIRDSFHALGVDAGAHAASQAPSHGVAPAGTGPTSPRTAPAVHVGPVTYTGEGFDTCAAPSEATMASWRAASPYRAVGVYLGGINRACGDGNLSSTWVTDEVAAGWNLIPLYVGRQAACAYQSGLAAIDDASAGPEGAAAADDAAGAARYFGLGAGSPVYLDMEAWDTTNTACSAGVVAFVEAWTEELHRQGFSSGLYGSADAGIRQDIAPTYGHPGSPDDIAFAQWDGTAGTTSPYLPTGAWPSHQRVKQYNGNVTETWGGAKIQIDQDYADATVVGNQQPGVTAVSPASAAVGTVVSVTGRAFVPGSTTVRFGGVPAAAVTVSSSGQLTARVPARAIQAVDVTVTTAGGTSPTGAPDHFTYLPLVGAAADVATGGYDLATTAGNVVNFGAPWSGSMAGAALPAPVVGMAPDSSTGGYWLATAAGNVYNFGAPFRGSTAGVALPAPIVGIAADTRTGGYWLVTSKGNVYNFDAPWYGSTASVALTSPVVAVTGTATGYLLTTAAGDVYPFNTASHGSAAGVTLPSPVVTTAYDSATGGYWLVTAAGNVYPYDAPWYGSTAHTAIPARIAALVPTATGYLLTTWAGNVFAYDTTWYGSPAAGSPTSG